MVFIGLIKILYLLIILLGDNMKKILILLLFMPIIVFAYSNKIIPGGETIGIEINNDGLIVIGLYKINDKYINNYFKIGDKIKKINGEDVYSVDDLISNIGDDIDNVEVLYERNNKEYIDKLELVKVNDVYKTGLYIKNNTLGIGTLTYIDTESNIYGALGHVINESRSGVSIDVKSGFSYDANITSFSKSRDGNPGSKNADIDKSNIFGSILSNSDYGIYGFVINGIDKDSMDIASLNEVKKGDAYILTSNLNNVNEYYKINILKIDFDNKDKSLYFDVVDDKLLDMSGGIVQGMSGSPIIQDNKIIGCVTRVIVNDVSKGYGISIVTMLEEGDKIKSLRE